MRPYLHTVMGSRQVCRSCNDSGKQVRTYLLIVMVSAVVLILIYTNGFVKIDIKLLSYQWILTTVFQVTVQYPLCVARQLCWMNGGKIMSKDCLFINK